MDVDVVGVPVDEHGRLTGAELREALAEAGADDVFAVVATGGTTNFGIVDDLAGVAEVCRGAGSGCTSTARTAAPAWPRRACAQLFDGIEHADSFIVDPHKWLFAPFDAARWSTGTRRRDGPRTPSTPATSTSSTDGRRLEPLRLRLPPDPPRPRPAVLVLLGGPRHRAYTEAIERR